MWAAVSLCFTFVHWILRSPLTSLWCHLLFQTEPSWDVSNKMTSQTGSLRLNWCEITDVEGSAGVNTLLKIIWTVVHHVLRWGQFTGSDNESRDWFCVHCAAAAVSYWKFDLRCVTHSVCYVQSPLQSEQLEWCKNGVSHYKFLFAYSGFQRGFSLLQKPSQTFNRIWLLSSPYFRLNGLISCFIWSISCLCLLSCVSPVSCWPSPPVCGAKFL